MPRVPIHVGLLGLLLAALLLWPAPAWALARTFVSGSGSNTNPCTREAPCRSLQRGINLVDAGGEVVILDSGSYAPFTVTKAVTVVAAPGVHAGITVTTGTGITVNAGPTDVVILGGLTLTGLGGSNGIVFSGGSALHIENVAVRGFTTGSGLGISHEVGGGQLFVKDTSVRRSFTGIFVRSFTGPANAALEHVVLEGNATGLNAFADAKVVAWEVRRPQGTGSG